MQEPKILSGIRVMAIAAADMAPAYLVVLSENEALCNELYELFGEAPECKAELIQDLMLRHPDRFPESELTLLVEGLLSEQDLVSIFEALPERLHRQNLRAIESHDAELEVLHAPSMPRMDISPYEYRDYEIPLCKADLHTHPSRAGKGDKHAGLQARPPLSHRQLYPFRPPWQR